MKCEQGATADRRARGAALLFGSFYAELTCKIASKAGRTGFKGLRLSARH